MVVPVVPEMPGRRLPDGASVSEAEPRDYWKPKGRPEGEWWFRDPFGHCGRVSTHTVTEHEDGTITVEPSILDEGEGERFHGWLRRGVWSW